MTRLILKSLGDLRFFSAHNVGRNWITHIHSHVMLHNTSDQQMYMYDMCAIYVAVYALSAHLLNISIVIGTAHHMTSTGNKTMLLPNLNGDDDFNIFVVFIHKYSTRLRNISTNSDRIEQ